MIITLRPNKTRLTYCLALLFFLTAGVLPLNLQAATSVSQFGITWTFDKDYATGQFANGDYWVVGPVTITGINPPSTNISGRVKNGSMVNPSPANDKQGYDNSMGYVTYDAALNKGLNMPLVLAAGSSLVSTISVDAAAALPQLKGASILTVLASAPAAGSFRPAYSGTNKTIKFNKSNLNYAELGKLATTPSQPRVTQQAGDKQADSVERMFERPWLDHLPNWTTEYIHPADNMLYYGRDLSDQVGTAALVLNLNLTDSAKETLLIRFVQLGIDNYGVIAGGGQLNWHPVGGHASGRKWPILFAGIVLNDADMKAIGTTTRFSSEYSPYPVFGEDGQTFYVSQTDVALKGHRDSEGAAQQDYLAGDIGLPEWGIEHVLTPQQDDRTWVSNTKSVYRQCCTANSWAGFVLAAHIMGAKTLWNHDALFDYTDRYMAIEASLGDSGTYNRSWSRFSEEMWDRHRANYGCVWTRTNRNDTYSNGSNGCDSNTPPPSNQAPTANAGTDQTITDTDNNGSHQVTLNGSGSSDPDGSITSYVWKEGGTQIATGASSTVTRTVGQHTITLTVTDNGGLTATDTVVIIVSPPADTTPPSILSVTASESSVEITFNENLDHAPATNIRNYSINQGITVNSCSHDAQNNKVILNTTKHTDGTLYTLTVSGISDISGNRMAVTTRSYTYTEGLVGHWTFDETGGDIANDSSGNGNAGILKNGLDWVAGKTNDGVEFAVSNDAVAIQTTGFDTASGTIAMWIYSNRQTMARHYLFGHATGTLENRIQLYLKYGSLCLGLGDSHETSMNIQQLENQQWYHIALTWSGTNYSVRVDGLPMASGTFAGLTEFSANAEIGNNGITRDKAFNGIIDDVRIYNYALAADEIAQLAD